MYICSIHRIESHNNLWLSLLMCADHLFVVISGCSARLRSIRAVLGCLYGYVIVINTYDIVYNKYVPGCKGFLLLLHSTIK